MIKGNLQEFHHKLQLSAMNKGIPVYGGFELTPRCNLNCKMCYVKLKSKCNKFINEELSTEQWIEIGHAAADNGALSVFLTGGEPLIRDDFKEIYSEYVKLGFRLTLFTNGSLITEEFVKWLVQKPPSTVDITLYGASDDTYYNLCGQKEVYKRVINSIELLLKYKINIRIKTTIVHTNMKDFNNIVEISKSYGLELLINNLIHGHRVKGIIDIENERLSPSEMINFPLGQLEKYECNDTDIIKLRNAYKDIPTMFCFAGKSSFFVNWKGNLTPCPLFEKPFAKPLEIGFKKAWDILRELVLEIPGNEECIHCESRVFCPVCPGRLYLETGKFNGHSDYVCNLAKEKQKLFKIN